MIDDREILRHLEEGGPAVHRRPEPPALDLAAIVGEAAAADVTTASQAPGSPAKPSGARRTWNLRPLVAIGGALACTALGLVAGAAIFGSGGDIAPDRVVATTAPTTPGLTGAPDAAPTRVREVTLDRFENNAPPGATAQVNVFTESDGRTVDLRVTGLPQPKRGEYYELWVLGDAGKMISLGIVRVNAAGTAEARLPLPVSLRRFPVFDLSLEPGDGDPTHSGNSLLRSAAVA